LRALFKAIPAKEIISATPVFRLSVETDFGVRLEDRDLMSQQFCKYLKAQGDSMLHKQSTGNVHLCLVV
jgi:hypothetical protein